jgi:hypothetical protein
MAEQVSLQNSNEQSPQMILFQMITGYWEGKKELTNWLNHQALMHPRFIV